MVSLCVLFVPLGFLLYIFYYLDDVTVLFLTLPGFLAV